MSKLLEDDNETIFVEDFATGVGDDVLLNYF